MVPGLLIMLLFSTTEGRETSHNQSKAIPPAYLYNKYQFGTLWQVYLPVMTYDLVYSSMYLGGSFTGSSTNRTLLDVTSNLRWVIAERHPCLNSSVVITGAQWKGQTYFELAYDSSHISTDAVRICGLFHVTYIPGSDKEATDPLSHSAEEPLILIWDFGSNGLFAINLTLSDLVAPSSYGCEDARVEITGHSTVTIMFCPNQGAKSVLGTDISLQLILRYNKHAPFTNHESDNYFTKISFHYQILDRDTLSLKDRYPGIQRAVLGEVYTLQVDSNIDIFRTLTDSSIGLMTFPNALVYIFSLNINNYLTPVVLRKHVTCNYHNAELIFYDGPPTLYMQPFLPILKLWSCTEMSNDIKGRHDNEEVRGSIGVLNFAVVVPKNDKNESFSLVLTWEAQHMLSSVFRLRTINLGLSTNKTIHLIPRHSTAYEVVQIVAPKGKFVRLWFSDIKYVPFTHYPSYSSMCYTGIGIDDPTKMHLGLELICSNSTAEHIVKHYKKNGLTAGQSAVISLIQYWWVARVSAIIIVSTDYCAGYINLLHPPEKNIIKPFTHTLTGGIVSFEPTYEEKKVKSMILNVVTKIWFQRLPGTCARLQLVHFRHLSSYTFRLNMRVAAIQYVITSEDLTSPARFLIDASSVRDEIQLRHMSSLYTLHLFSLENTFTQQLESLHPEKWDAEAYVAQVRVHTSLLTHAAGLTVQVEDGKLPPVCIIERGGNVVIFHNLYLSGPCAYAELQEGFNVMIYKPYYNKHCCRLEGAIDHWQETEGVLMLRFFKKAQSTVPLIQEMWEISGDTRGLNIKLNVLCQQYCAGIKFSTWTEDNVTIRTTIVYRASLIEQSYVAYESFRQSGDWGRICLRHACYIVSLNPRITTWNSAKEECANKNASLLSINSDSEWTMLTALAQETIKESLNLFEIFYIYYIGLRLKVSKPDKH